MTTLLHIEVSPMGENSISRAVTAEFLEAWKAANPGGTIIERDLAANPVPLLDGEAIFADYTPEDQRPATMAAKRALRQELIDEITGVDEIVVSTPMWNWNVPSPLKAYIDQIIVPGVLDGSGAAGLTGKKVTAIMAQGGSYAPGAPREGWDFGSGYLNVVFTALGSTDAKTVARERAAQQLVSA
jgi:FMN-dependent NADH-azoreductase